MFHKHVPDELMNLASTMRGAVLNSYVHNQNQFCFISNNTDELGLTSIYVSTLCLWYLNSFYASYMISIYFHFLVQSYYVMVLAVIPSKHAEICSIHKKGNNLDISNYRPISIPPSMIFEKEIVNQVYILKKSYIWA